jgi:hypothetical protein
MTDINAFTHKLRADLDRLLHILHISPGKVKINGSLEVYVINPLGELLGIGTLAPQKALDLTNANAQIYFNRAGSYKWTLGVEGATPSIGGATSQFILYDNSAGAARLIVAHTTGNFGVGPAAPTAKFSVAEKCAMNADGGFMVKLTNKTGANSVKGEVVTPDTTANNGAKKIIVDVPNPIGVFYESGIADGAEAWVVVSGIADVYFIGNTTRGHIARGFETADGAGYVTGQAMSEAVPTSPFSVDKHFYEIGHILESRTGAGLSKVVLHFN